MNTSAESDMQSEEEEQPAAPAPVAEEIPSAENESAAEPSKKPFRRVPSKQRERHRASRTSPKHQPTLPQVTDRFAACGRCSYFWAGYRVLFGEEGLTTAVAQSESGWLDLEWNGQMPELVHKSYGVRLDITHFHYEGCCQECHRTFVYQAAENEDEADAFCIEISPRMAQ